VTTDDNNSSSASASDFPEPPLPGVNVPPFAEAPAPPPAPLAEAAKTVGDATRNATEAVQETVHDWSEAAKAKSNQFVEAQSAEVDRNPTAAVLKALVLGFALGLIIRFLQSSAADTREKRRREVDVKHRPTLEETKFHLGSIFLPFLWPLFQRARTGYERSAETLEQAAARVKKADLQKAGRRSVKKVEDWIEEEVTPVVKTGRKRIKKLLS